MKRSMLALLALVALFAPGLAAPSGVGRLSYNDDPAAACFQPDFLEALGHDSVLADVPLDGEALFAHPFVVMAGERAFTFTAAQRQALRLYLRQGGFLVASAGCGSAAWSASFEREMDAVFPGLAWRDLPLDHPIFRGVYHVRSVHTRRPGPTPALRGLEIDGRLVAVFAPAGLNDSLTAEPACCCCGGNEIENARAINANLLAYALTH